MNAGFVAHLSHRLRVSYCHWPMSVVHRASSVVRRQQFALNNISSETARPRAFIFSILHCLTDPYQVCSNGGSGVQNGPAVGGLGFKNEIYLKSSSAEPLGSGACNLVCNIAW